MRISILRIVLVVWASIPLAISVNPSFTCYTIYNAIEINFASDPGWNCSTDDYINKSISTVRNDAGGLPWRYPDEYIPANWKVSVPIWGTNQISATATISNNCFADIDDPAAITCTSPLPYIANQTESGILLAPDVNNEIFVEIGNPDKIHNFLLIWTQREGPVHDIPDQTFTYLIVANGMPLGIYEYLVQYWKDSTDNPMWLADTSIYFTYGGCYTSFTQNGNIVTVTLTMPVYTLYIYIYIYIYRSLLQGAAAARPL